jgi:cytochrome P450 family 110
MPAVTLPPGPRTPSLIQGWQYAYRYLDLFERCGRRYGDTFTLRLPAFGTLVLFSDPDAVKEIFASSREELRSASGLLQALFGPNALPLLDGARHHRDQRMLHGALHGDVLTEYGRSILTITDRAVDGWPVGETFELERRFHQIAFDILFRVVFGFDDEEVNELGDRLWQRVASAPNPMWLWPALQVDLGRLTPWGRYARAMNDVTGALQRVIHRHRMAGSASRSAVLSGLIAARDENGEGLTDEDLRDEMITFLLAGYDTMATALSWAVYDLLANPEVLANVRREMRDAVGDGPLTAEAVNGMQYLEATVKESLRLHPIIAVTMRVVGEPIRIGGWDLPPGVGVGPCIYLIHRRPDLWPDPERFDPMRFIREDPSPYKFVPFGGGYRRCIGMAFTLSEMKFVLAQLFARTDLRLLPGYHPKVVRRVMTFAPSAGLPVVRDRRVPWGAPRGIPAAAYAHAGR